MRSPRSTALGGFQAATVQLATHDDHRRRPQIVLTSASGTVGVAPPRPRALGAPMGLALPVLPIAQPARIDDGEFLVGDGITGVRRIGVTRASDGWTVSERWSSNRLKPYFNDLVLHRDTPMASTARSWRASI